MYRTLESYRKSLFDNPNPSELQKLESIRHIYAHLTSWWGRLFLSIGCKAEVDSLIRLCHYLLDQQVTDDTNLSYADRCDRAREIMEWLTLCYRHKNKIPTRQVFAYGHRTNAIGSAQIFKEMEDLALVVFKAGVELSFASFVGHIKFIPGSGEIVFSNVRPKIDTNLHRLMAVCVVMQKAFRFELKGGNIVFQKKLESFEKIIQSDSLERLYRERDDRYFS